MASEQKQQQVYGFCTSSSVSLGFRRGVRQVFRSDSGFVRPSGPSCFAVKRFFFCYFFSPLFSLSNSRFVSEETFVTFRGHLAPISFFTVIVICCKGWYVFATAAMVISSTAIYFCRPGGLGAGTMVLVGSSS